MNDNNLMPFWSVNQNGKIDLNNYLFKKFLEQNNYFKNKPNANSTFNIIKKNGIFLEIKDETDLKDFILNYVEDNDLGIGVYNLMSGNLKYFKRDFLSMISTKEIQVMKDNKDNAYFFYNNCIVNITKNERKIIDYKDVNISIWKKQVINRDFIEADHHESQFRTFVWKVSGEDVERYNTLQSVLGYLLHSYKTNSNNRAIIFNDEMISDNPNGRSGKGLIWNALKQLKNVQSLDGKTFTFNKSFPYQNVSTDCQILVFDDVERNFNFESLFSIITEGICIEYKGKDAIRLTVEESPKIIITTNYTIKGDGGSHEARKFEVEMSTFFNADYTPEMFFGNKLFNDWDELEWARFDNYMMECLRKYLNNGLVRSNTKNLEIRKLIDKISSELHTFIPSIPNNEWVNVKTIYDNFLNAYPELRKWYKQNSLTIGLKSYAKHYGIKYHTTTAGGITKIMFEATKSYNDEPKGDIWDSPQLQGL
jgi:hypothetical protein